MGNKNKRMEVKGVEITYSQVQQEDFICITDIARYKETERTDHLIQNWMRNRNTIEFLGIWEKINNPQFKPLEFEGFRKQAGLNSFVLTPTQWVSATNATGITVKRGRYGGTYAHKDIAFEFATWISVEFKLYLLKEFQRLKEKEQGKLEWNIKRQLTKINYRIHTDAIKENLIPKNLSKQQISHIYANEADVLNVALFGKTAKQWREQNPDKDGNIRDYANVSQLVCLANLESLNALLIDEGAEQSERLQKLNQIAIQQMRILLADHGVKRLEVGDE